MERERKSRVLLALGPHGLCYVCGGVIPPKLLSQKPGSYSNPARTTHPPSDITTMMVACMGQGEMLKTRLLVP